MVIFMCAKICLRMKWRVGMWACLTRKIVGCGGFFKQEGKIRTWPGINLSAFQDTFLKQLSISHVLSALLLSCVCYISFPRTTIHISNTALAWSMLYIMFLGRNVGVERPHEVIKFLWSCNLIQKVNYQVLLQRGIGGLYLNTSFSKAFYSRR